MYNHWYTSINIPPDEKFIIIERKVRKSRRGLSEREKYKKYGNFSVINLLYKLFRG